jgi:hypothetical protein
MTPCLKLTASVAIVCKDCVISQERSLNGLRKTINCVAKGVYGLPARREADSETD